MCETCDYADQHGWFGPELAKQRATHCRKCHLSWRGVQQAHCVVCCGHYGSLAVLHLHKDGVRCLDPAGLKDEETGLPLLEQIDSGFSGMVWVRQGAVIGVPPPRQIDAERSVA